MTNFFEHSCAIPDPLTPEAAVRYLLTHLNDLDMITITPTQGVPFKTPDAAISYADKVLSCPGLRAAREFLELYEF